MWFWKLYVRFKAFRECFCQVFLLFFFREFLRTVLILLKKRVNLSILRNVWNIFVVDTPSPKYYLTEHNYDQSLVSSE